MRTAKTLIRLGECPGWSESSLGAHLFCWFCHVAAHQEPIQSNSTSYHVMRKPVYAICKQKRHRSVWVYTGRKPLGQVFSWRGLLSNVKGKQTPWSVSQEYSSKPADGHQGCLKQGKYRLMTKSTQWLSAQRRLKSAWASAQSDQSLRCALNGQLRTQAVFADSEDCSDWANAQADLSLHWAHCLFVGFVMRRLNTKRRGQTDKQTKNEPRHEKTFFRRFTSRWDSNRSAQLQRLARLELLDIVTGRITLSKKRTTKALIRLGGYTGWSASLLFAYGVTGFLMAWLKWQW